MCLPDGEPVSATDEIDAILLEWRFADPYELALFVAALTAAANQHPALEEYVRESSERVLRYRPPRAKC